MLSTRALFTGTLPAPLTGPYTPAHAGTPILTQLHCHTNQSDGDYTPAQIVDYYVAAGYGCLQITDHDLVTEQPAGVDIALPGNELSPDAFHIISVGNTYTRGVAADAQTLIDGVKAAGGEALIAHPHYVAGMSQAAMEALTGWLGMEIHNGRVETGAASNPITQPGFALARWDAILVSRSVWGVAVDDLHLIDAFNTYDVGRTWVFTADESAEGIMAALRRGDFVADVSNHGVVPGYPVRTRAGVSLTCSGASRIEAWGPSGLLDAADADTLAYALAGDEGYVRLAAVGTYSEGFGSALSDRWQAYDGTWAASGGVLSLSSSDSEPRRIILRRHRAGDFTARVKVRLGAGSPSGLGLMFNVLDASRFYMLRLGESSVSGWNNVLAVGYTTDGGFGVPPLDSHAITATEGTWYTMAMAYTAATGRIQAKAWESAGAEPEDWQLDVTDTTWTHGAFGFRAAFAAAFDDLDIDGFRTYYQPIAVG